MAVVVPSTTARQDPSPLQAHACQKRGVNPTTGLRGKPRHTAAVFINIDPVDGGRRKGSPRKGTVSVLLSAAQTGILASYDGVNTYA